jgi:hypothetical protein
VHDFGAEGSPLNEESTGRRNARKEMMKTSCKPQLFTLDEHGVIQDKLLVPLLVGSKG